MLYFKTSRLLLALSLGGLLCLAGCVDTSAVTTFSKTATVAQEKFPSIAADYHNSCLRGAAFDIRDDLSDSTTATDDDFAPSTIRKKAESTCGTSSQLNSRLLTANRALTDYMVALGNLSADSAIETDTQVGALADSITATGTFKEPQVTATKALLQFSLNVALGAWRDRKLSRAISEQNANIQVVTFYLRDLTDAPYKQFLKNEEEKMSSYYSDVLKAPTTTPALRHMIEKDWENDQHELENRRQTAAAYRGILLTIAQGHQELYNNRNSLGDKQTRTILTKYAKQLEPLIKKLNEAF